MNKYINIINKTTNNRYLPTLCIKLCEIVHTLSLQIFHFLGCVYVFVSCNSKDRLGTCVIIFQQLMWKGKRGAPNIVQLSSLRGIIIMLPLFSARHMK